MLLRSVLKMSQSRAAAANRTAAIARHMSSGVDSTQSEQFKPVLFESNGGVRKYILNRQKKLNALNTEMITLLRSEIETWSHSDLCKIIVGTGTGRAFCAGGDVATVLKDALDPQTRPQSIEFFKQEFELDYALASTPKPYVAIMDGITMGGGAGLAVPAPFRVATEKTIFAMPEAKIGYCPDVGASFYLSRLDGELGTYLALTSDTLSGREVFEHGLATHFITSRTVPSLLSRLSALDDPAFGIIDRTIEELHSERQADEPPSKFSGAVRIALDHAFRHNSVESIFQDLKSLTFHADASVREWATKTQTTLFMRSPTSLKVALSAVRRGKKLSLLEALQLEMRIATAYCNGASSDFRTGISAVLIDRLKDTERPAWSPTTIEEVNDDILNRFFSDTSSFVSAAPQLSPPSYTVVLRDPMRHSLPSDIEIEQAIRSMSPSDGFVALPALLSKCADLYGNKHGIQEKVVEVVQRRAAVIDRNGTQYARWNT